MTGGRARAIARTALRCVGGFALATALACDGGDAGPVRLSDAGATAGPLTVFAVAYPLQYFAERIGGDAVDARFPVPAGVDPAEWSPDAVAVAEVQSGDLVLLNGPGYASWVGRASLPRRRLVDTSAGFRDRRLPAEAGVRHAHGPEGEHAHEGVAGMSWLDPLLAVEQARAIAAAFVTARPGDAAAFERGLAALEDDLRALDRRFGAAAEAVADEPIFFSHPVYEYFVRRYGLNARSLHWEPHEAPTPPMWADFRQALVEHPAQALLWEGPPGAATEAALERLGVRSFVFDPAAGRAESGDYLDRMGRNAGVLEALVVNHPGAPGVEKGGSSAR
jgi:zinc transport system substrate-binding protein